MNKPNVAEKKFKRMKFGLIEGDFNYNQFIIEFEKEFDCIFEKIKLVDEIFKKRDDSLSIYTNGIRVVSYPD